MFTVAQLGVPTITPVGSEVSSTETVKFSSPSNLLSSNIGTSNTTLVTPSVNVTLYGPEL